MGQKLGISVSGQYSFDETVRNICCNGEHSTVTDTNGNISVSLKAIAGIPNLSISHNASIFVGMTEYTTKAKFGVFLNGDITLGGGVSLTGTCNGDCLSGTIGLSFTAQAEFTFEVEACKKTATQETCNCIEIDFLSAQLKIHGSVKYDCTDGFDFLNAGTDPIPIVTKVNLGVGFCSVDIDVTWGTIPGKNFI